MIEHRWYSSIIRSKLSLPAKNIYGILILSRNNIITCTTVLSTFELSSNIIKVESKTGPKIKMPATEISRKIAPNKIRVIFMVLLWLDFDRSES